MATWYRQPNAPKPAAAQPVVKSAPAPRKASWAQLRSRMGLADELHAGWVLCEQEAPELPGETGTWAPPQRPAIAGTRIDAQFIAVQRTQLAAVPTRDGSRGAVAPGSARGGQDAPMRLLQEISLGSRYRLAAVVA